MSRRRKELGRRGEQIAEGYLQTCGYKILEKNYRCPLGEIDLVAEEKGVLIFVEVRTLSSKNWGLPQMSINFTKQKKIIKTSLYYLSEKNMWNRTCRFDIVAITLPIENGEQRVELIKGAFEAQNYY